MVTLEFSGIQGAPPVFLNNEAPLRARSLDALACAVRTCCDQANGRFAAISKEAKANNMEEIPQKTIITPTTTAGALCKAKSLRIPSLHETSCVSFRVVYLRTLTLSLYLCYFF